MKVAIPLDETKEKVCMSFGRAPYFLFVEDEKQMIKANPGAMSQSGAGLEAAQFLVDENVDVLITQRCGQNAGDVFKEAEIVVYETKDLVVLGVLEAYKENKLQLLANYHAGYVGIK